MKNSLFVAFAFSFAVLIACTARMNDCKSLSGPEETFTLSQRGCAMLKSDGFSVRFDSVSGDSRCPVNVQCMWAGRVDAIFTLMKDGEQKTVTLSAGDLGQGGSAVVRFRGERVHLDAVEPMTEEGKKIAQKDYRVTVSVKK
ncbi:MAG: hypothetical protein H6565_06100 [Lewinellaceae bacterium]|nr:hypothetical protein [Lewinellaceae bacterium]